MTPFNSIPCLSNCSIATKANRHASESSSWRVFTRSSKASDAFKLSPEEPIDQYQHIYSRARVYHALPIQLSHGEIKVFPCLQALLGDFSRYQTVRSHLEYKLRPKVSRAKTAMLTVI